MQEHTCHLCRSRDPRCPAPVAAAVAAAAAASAPVQAPAPVTAAAGAAVAEQAAQAIAAAVAPIEQLVEIGSAVCNIVHACWQCKRVAELHAAVKQRTFPPHLSAALKEASRTGFYAIPKRRGPKAVAAALKAAEAGRQLEMGALFLDSETESEDPDVDEGILSSQACALYIAIFLRLAADFPSAMLSIIPLQPVAAFWTALFRKKWWE
jgi:hypothetical protein